MVNFNPFVAEVTFGGTPAGFDNLEYVWVVGLVYIALAFLGLLADGYFAVRLYLKPVSWDHLGAVLKRRSWSWAEGLQFAALLVLLHALGIVAYQLSGRMALAADGPDSFGIVLQSLVFHWAGLLLIIVIMHRRKTGWSSAFGFGRRPLLKDIGLGVLCYVAAMPFVLFYSWLYETCLRVVGYQPELQEVAWAMTNSMSSGMRVYMLILAVCIAPLFEELLFRGVGLPLISRGLGLPGSVIVISAFFAIIHFHLPALVPLFIVAASFSIAYIYTGSMVVPITMHALFNGLNLAMLMLLRGP